METGEDQVWVVVKQTNGWLDVPVAVTDGTYCRHIDYW